jgi:hypothetical protein
MAGQPGQCDEDFDFTRGIQSILKNSLGKSGRNKTFTGQREDIPKDTTRKFIAKPSQNINQVAGERVPI